jgi:hypothetical protein
MPEKSTVAIVLAIVLAAATMPFLACGDGGKSPEEAKADFCTSLDQFQQSVSTLQDVGPGTSVDQLQSDVDDVQASFADVQESASDVKGANVDNLDSAVSDLREAMSDIAGSETISEALSSIESQLAAVEGAWEELTSSFSCS